MHIFIDDINYVNLTQHLDILFVSILNSISVYIYLYILYINTINSELKNSKLISSFL